MSLASAEVEALIPSISECDCLWRLDLKDVMKVKCGHKGEPNPNMTGVLTRRDQEEDHGKGGHLQVKHRGPPKKSTLLTASES